MHMRDDKGNIASHVDVIDKSNEIMLPRIIPNTRYVIVEPLWSKDYLKSVNLLDRVIEEFIIRQMDLKNQN